MPDGEVRWQARVPVPAEHEVQADGQALAVHSEVAEQSAEAEHQSPAARTGKLDVEHGDLVVKVPVEVDGLGQNGTTAGPGRQAGVSRAVPADPGRHPLVADDLDR